MSKPKILICDDEEGIRESLKLILEKDYEATAVNSPEECLKFLKDNPVDLVLMDIKMPRVSGIDMVRMIRAIKPEQKIIMVTGYKVVETAQEAINAGASDYIIKPFNSKDILESVKRVLG